MNTVLVILVRCHSRSVSQWIRNDRDLR